MQPLRTTLRRVPQQLNRIAKPTATRHFATTPAAMSLFPRFTSEFAPIFRLMDDYDRNVFRNIDRNFEQARTFSPKFDVKELKDAYELHGEFPGIEQNNINIEWTDQNTLTVSGRHETVKEEGRRPQGFIEEGAEKKDKEHQPSVEDEAAEGSQAVTKQPGDKEVTKKSDDEPKFWVSERSVGEFHRSFSFPQRVDQDAVKASLKNGILSIVVPKARAPQPRKINIE